MALRRASSLFLRYIGPTILVPGVLLCLVVMNAIHTADGVEHRRLLERDAGQRITGFETALSAAGGELATLAGYFDTVGTVNRDAFYQLGRQIKARNPAIIGVAWVPFVQRDEREGFEAAIQQELHVPFQITERASSGKPVPAGDRAAYWPLLYADLPAIADLQSGLDLATVADRFETLDQMRSNLATITTGRLRIAKSAADEFSIFLAQPVVSMGDAEAGTAVVEQVAPPTVRRLRGFAMGLIGINDLVRMSMEPYGDDPRFSLVIQDQSALPGRQFLYNGTKANSQTDIVLAERIRQIGGRSWRIAILTNPETLGPTDWSGWMVLAVGFVMSGAVIAFAQQILVRWGREGGASVRALMREQVDLVQNSDRLAGFTALSQDWFWETDRLYRFTFLSDKASAAGFDPLTLLGLDLFQRDDDPAEVESRRKMLGLQTGFDGYILSYQAADGTRVLSLRGVPMVDAAGEFTGYRGAASEITRMRRVEADYAGLQRQLAAVSQSERALISVATRQMKHGLAQIKMNLLQLQELPLKNTEKEIVKSTLHIAGGIHQAMSNIVDCNLLASGQLRLDRQPFHIEAIVADIVSMLTSDAERKGIFLKTQLPSQSLPWLMGDEKRIRQILFNLLANAIEHSGRTDVTVTVAAADRGDGRVDLGLGVRDRGVGFTPSEVEKITTWLQAPGTGPLVADPAQTARNPGLGLAICRDLCALMGGGIGLDSQPGQGSTVRAYFVLDRAMPPVAAIRARLDKAPAKTGTLRILLAEDNEINQMMITDILREAGYDVVTAKTGQDVLRILAQDKIGLILMDIQMPEMDGMETTRHIRAMAGPIGQIPIIAMTANSAPADRDETLTIMDGYVTKPVDVAALKAILARYGTETTDPGSVTYASHVS